MKFSILAVLIAPLLAAASPVDSATNAATAPQRKDCDTYYNGRWDSRAECGRESISLVHDKKLISKGHKAEYEKVCRTCHGRRHPDCTVEIDERCVRT
jgi:hypothetical protein